MIKDLYGNTRLYGIYRGVVTANNDPLSKGRIKMQIPQILATETTEWAWPVDPRLFLVDNEATLAVPLPPTIGQGVWVMFEGGDPSYPVWLGTFGDAPGLAIVQGANPL